jgi:hypothetical protein
VWVGWLAGGEVGVGGRAVLPDTNLSEGRGPRTVEVIWVTIGSEKYYSMRKKVKVVEMDRGSMHELKEIDVLKSVTECGEALLKR